MDGQNKSFLLKIATEVENLLTNEANRKVFERYGREFHKDLAVYQRSYDQRQQKVEEYRGKSFQDERLRDKRSGPPKKRYVWYDDSYIRTGDPDKGFWGPPCKELDQYPGLRLVSIPSKRFGVSPKNHKETLKKSYRSLIIIHDCLRKDFAPISKGAWPASLAGLVGCLDFNLTDEEQTNIEIALEYVKTDLASTKQNESQPAKDAKYWFKFVCKVVAGIGILLGILWTAIQIYESVTFKKFVVSRHKSQSVYDPNAQTESNDITLSSKTNHDTSNSLPDLNLLPPESPNQ